MDSTVQAAVAAAAKVGFNGLSGTAHRLLALAYLAEHHADDAEAMTAEWLDRIMYRDTKTDWSFGRLRIAGSDNTGFSVDYVSSYRVPLPGVYKTRGEVRDLCRVLKAPLREPERNG